jgi:uroporphyrinogen decarboxylase
VSKITSKERLKAAIDRKVPDRLPATTHHLMDSYLNSHLGGMSVPEFFEYFKLDPIHWVNSVEYTAEQLKNWKISSLELEGHKYLTRRYTIRTPGGDLTCVLQYNEHTTWVTEHLIKEKSDIDILAKYMPSPVCDVSYIEKEYHSRPDALIRGHIVCMDIFGQPGCWQDAACLVGIEKLIMETFDDPAWVHELLQTLLKRKMDYVSTMEGAPFDILELGGGDASSTVISPKLFDTFVAPYDSQIIKAAHKHGQKIVYHTCGGMMPILENIADMSPDAMETFTPPGMGGDVDLAEAKKRIGDKVCIIGGFDQFHFLTGCTPEDTSREVRRCFEAAGEGGGFILSPSDHFFEAETSLLRAYAEEAHNCIY